MQIKQALFVMQSTVHQRAAVIMYLIIIFMFVWMLALSFGVAVMLHDGGDTFSSIRAPSSKHPRPISFHSNCIQSQPLFLLINTAVSLSLRRRTRIHLDGCISWGDLSRRSRRGNSCWSDSLDFSQFCNHTKTGRNHSFIFILSTDSASQVY